MALYLHLIKRNIKYAIVVAVELTAVYILLNLCFSLILQSAADYGGEKNTDAITLFGYIAVAALALYVFTVAIQNVVGYRKNSRFYQVSVALGATKKQLVRAKVLYGATVYGIALAIAFIITLSLDLKEMDEDGIRFFTFAGQGVAFAVYEVLYVLNALADAYAIKKSDMLNDLLGGTDNV